MPCWRSPKAGRIMGTASQGAALIGGWVCFPFTGPFSRHWRAERCTFAATLSALLGWSPKEGHPHDGLPMVHGLHHQRKLRAGAEQALKLGPSCTPSTAFTHLTQPVILIPALLMQSLHCRHCKALQGWQMQQQPECCTHLVHAVDADMRQEWCVLHLAYTPYNVHAEYAS